MEEQPRPKSGDRTFHATTPIGVVRVWATRGFWASDVALPGVARASLLMGRLVPTKSFDAMIRKQFGLSDVTSDLASRR